MPGSDQLSHACLQPAALPGAVVTAANKLFFSDDFRED